MQKKQANVNIEEQDSYETDVMILDQESYDRLKASLKAKKDELERVKEQLIEVRETEPINSIEDPSSSWVDLIHKYNDLLQKIADLKHDLNRSKVENIQKDANIIGLNDSVMLELDYSDGEFETVCKKLVERNPDPDENEISKGSAIGAAILGRKVGDFVTTKIESSGLILKIKILSKV